MVQMGFIDRATALWRRHGAIVSLPPAGHKGLAIATFREALARPSSHSTLGFQVSSAAQQHGSRVRVTLSRRVNDRRRRKL